MSPNKIFMFLKKKNPSGNAKIQKLMAKHTFKCFDKENVMYVCVYVCMYVAIFICLTKANTDRNNFN